MVKRVLPLAVVTAGIALVIGGIAFATERPLLGGDDQAATTSTQSDPAAPLEGNSGQGTARCSDATAHALEVLLAHQATGGEVGNSIAAVQACGTGAHGSESAGESGRPEWVPGPPPWAGTDDASGGDDRAATTSAENDPVTPLEGNSGQGAARCSDATAHALEVLLAHQAAGGEVGNSIAAIQACGTGAHGSESSGEAGPPEWVPGPPPWAGHGAPESAKTGGPPDWVPGPPPGPTANRRNSRPATTP